MPYVNFFNLKDFSQYLNNHLSINHDDAMTDDVETSRFYKFIVIIF